MQRVRWGTRASDRTSPKKSNATSQRFCVYMYSCLFSTFILSTYCHGSFCIQSSLFFFYMLQSLILLYIPTYKTGSPIFFYTLKSLPSAMYGRLGHGLCPFIYCLIFFYYVLQSLPSSIQTSLEKNKVSTTTHAKVLGGGGGGRGGGGGGGGDHIHIYTYIYTHTLAHIYIYMCAYIYTQYIVCIYIRYTSHVSYNDLHESCVLAMIPCCSRTMLF